MKTSRGFLRHNRLLNCRRHSSFITEASPAPGCPFHLALPVHDMRLARDFYGGVLGLVEGRRADDKWQDYSLHGHQIVCHFVGEQYRCQDHFNPVVKEDRLILTIR